MKERKEKTKEKEQTIKQRKWLEIYLKTGNATRAAREVYDCKDESSAANIGYENVRKLDVTEALERVGLTDKFLFRHLKKGFKSTKLFGKSAIEHPDFMARHKYLETTLKLKKKLVERVEHTGEDGEAIKIDETHTYTNLSSWIVGTAQKIKQTDGKKTG